MIKNRNNKGFIQAIILIIVALVLLKYFFNISFNDILHSQIAQDLWTILKSLFVTLWQLILIVLDFLKQLVATAKDYVTTLKK